MEEYKAAMKFWHKMYGVPSAELRAEESKLIEPQKPNAEMEPPAAELHASGPAVTGAVSPEVRRYLSSLGRRGGSSRSPRKRAASRRNLKLAANFVSGISI
jgi:hypothetical protein